MIYILALIVVGLFYLLWNEKRENRMQINKLTNALIARTPDEAVKLDMADKAEPPVPTLEDNGDVADLADVGLSDWEKTILKNQN